MRRLGKGSSAGSTSGIGSSRGSGGAFATRGASGGADGSGAPSGRLRLALLAATVAAFLLIPAARALAGPVGITLTGSGSGRVTSDNGTPPIDCVIKAGVVSGTCNTHVTDDFSFTPTTLTATASPGFVFGGWTVGADTCTSNASPCQLKFPTFEFSYSLTATFIPPPDTPLPTTDGTSAGAGSGLVTLRGRVNPNGSALTECRFLYGTTTEYGESSPCDQSLASIGSGSSDVPVSASTIPLEPNTTYHFRLRTANLGGVAQGSDRSFTTAPAGAESCPNAAIRAEQGSAALGLPDCMALEQVSPSVKGNQHARKPLAISADDQRVLFNSIATLGDAANVNALGGDAFIGTRGALGWTTEGSNVPLAMIDSKAPLSGEAQASFSPDFSSWFAFATNEFFQGQSGGAFSRFSPALVNQSGTSPSAAFQGASADRSHLYFRPEDQRTDSFLPGDPVPSDGDEGGSSSEDFNVYVAQLDSAGSPSLSLLARDRDGKAWGGNCGARLGGMEGASGLGISLPNGYRNQGAVSGDGSRVYFSTRPDQAPAGNCTNANKERIMERVETPTGPVINELIASECDRVSPVCSADDGDDAYQGASIDQSKVYFTTNRQLADSDLDGSGASCEVESAVPGCDLYLYDGTKPAGQRLTQVSAGEDVVGQHEAGKEAQVLNSIAAISADGSHVYFVAFGALTTDPGPGGGTAVAGQPNLYLWNAESGETDFVAGPLANGGFTERDGGFLGSGLWGDDGGTWRNGAYPVPILGKDAEGHEIGGDGHLLLFQSKAPLTADDSDGGFMDLFRYDADAGTLQRISKAGPGGSDDGPFEMQIITGQKGFGDGTDYAERARRISEDGETAVFTTAEALLPGDLNGVEDAYMWRKGQLYRLPGSARTNSELAKNTPVVSEDGTTVAWHGAAQLLPSDGDSAQDVYIARVNGGFPTVVPQICTPDGGDGCQGAAGAPPADSGTASNSISGKGNVHSSGKTGAKRCPKGKRRVKRNGKVRCVKRKASKAQGGKHRAAGANRGTGR